MYTMLTFFSGIEKILGVTSAKEIVVERKVPVKLWENSRTFTAL